MLSLRRHRLAAALILLGATGVAFAGPVGARSNAAPAECELKVGRGVGSVELTALAHAAKATRGEYDFRVSGRGTDIRQGGPFVTGPDGTAELGLVTLRTGGSAYTADLQIEIAGKTISCSRRIGGGI